jgi:hypothetical protein
LPSSIIERSFLSFDVSSDALRVAQPCISARAGRPMGCVRRLAR